MDNDQSFDNIIGEVNISFEYEELYNFDENFLGVSWVWKYTHCDKITKIKYCDVCIDNDDGTSKRCLEAQLSVLSTTIPTPTTQQTIERVIQNHIENASPLPEQQQNCITYHLVAWIVKEMIPLNCINHDQFQDFCYEINK
ncbi:13194_t:CDS:2 [Racocetra persica]|uniref:13194_t:CDS:1 n=1 Tax=Racocetra persica TaxID=160502 RepID=A0ACA9N2K8_9GLOM|nr:13194_t:CDS:2 [Racocetra persica]